MPNQAYQDTVWSRNQLNREKMDNKIIDESGPTPESAGAEAVQESRNAAPTAPVSSGGGVPEVQPGGSPASLIGQAGMMSGNPYLMAAGLGVSVLAQGETNRRQQQQAQRQAYNERIQQRQQLMQQIASQGIQ